MTGLSQTLSRQWTRKQAAIFAMAFLLLGVAGGWSVRGLHQPAPLVSAKASDAPAPAAGQAAAQPAPDQLKRAADTQAAPLLDQLKSNPQDPALLTELGNIYYDAHQYTVSVDYYQRALQAKPADAAVRTDMATAYWYIGNADLAIAEFGKALDDSPNNPNALFNRGIVKWHGKNDAAGALADWQKLLATNPSYPEKDKVQQLIAEVKKQQAP